MTQHGKASIAHVIQDIRATWKTRALDDLLSATARLAKIFAAEFGNSDWAELPGFWHDLGKFHPAWQEYLRKETGYGEEAHVELKGLQT